MAAKKRLGRGLDALLGPEAKASHRAAKDAAEGLHELPVDKLQRGRYQPRTDIRQESLEELAASIRAQGVVQPIVVRPIAKSDYGQTRYEIIAGERRWRAAQMAGLHVVPVVVRDVPDEAAVAMSLIENIQRENLNPLEESTALVRLIEEFGMTHQQASEAVGRSRASVSNLLRLQELDPQVKKLVSERKLEMGHARALLGLSGAAQVEAANRVATRGMSVRDTEALVKRSTAGGGRSRPRAGGARLDPDLKRLQDDLGERLGARVQVQHGKGGKGKLVISYNSLDELDGILKKIR